MKRFFFTLLSACLALGSTAAVAASQPKLLPQSMPHPALLRMQKLYAQSLQQARSNTLVDSVVFMSWNSGQWFDFRYSKLIYDGSGRISEVLNYDPLSGSSSYTSKFEMSYSQGKLYRQSFKIANGTQFQEEMSVEYRYDSKGNRTSTSFSSWDPQGNLQAFGGDSLVYGYVGSEATSVSLLIGFGSGGNTQWTPITTLQNIEYNPQGHPIAFNQFEFDAGTGLWSGPMIISHLEWGFGWNRWEDVLSNMAPLNEGLQAIRETSLRLTQPTAYVAEYMENGNILPYSRVLSNIQHGQVMSIKEERFDGRWEMFEKYNYRYNAQYKVIKIEQFGFDSSLGAEVPVTEQAFRYDPAGFYTGETMSEYAGGQWSVSYGFRYTYFFDALQRVNSIEGAILNTGNGNWEQYDKMSYFYPGATLAVRTLNQLDIKAFPNPVSQFLNLQIPADKKIDRITLSNLQGQKVYDETLSQPVSYSGVIDLGNFPDGLYILQIQSANEIGSLRILKN